MTPLRHAITLEITGFDDDAGCRDGEAAGITLALRAQNVGGGGYRASFAVGAIGTLAASLANVSSEDVATFLINLGRSYRAAARAEAQAVRH